MTVFLGGGFAAKYLDGGGNFSVPLQWMLGLRRLKLDAIWLEHLPSEGNPADDRRKIDNFRRQLRAHGLGERYCLLYHEKPDSAHHLDTIRCIGMSKRELLDRLAGPNTLLNLSYSLHPPLLLKFERRIFCDLDPSEIIYWMTRMEMGQSTHHEFWTIGLNVNAPDCKLLKMAPSKLPGMEASSIQPSKLRWKTFYPLVDTKLYQAKPRPPSPKFTTIGQWYWGGAVEVDGEFPDLSKKYAFEPYLDLLAGALGEFTVIKGVDVSWKTGWLSDRAAAFLATGRPLVTEDSGAGKYLPRASGFHFVGDSEGAAAAVEDLLANWKRRSREARKCAEEVFDSAKNLRKILDL